MHVYSRQLTALHFCSDGGQWEQLMQLTTLRRLELKVVTPFDRAVPVPPPRLATLPVLDRLTVSNSTADLSPLLLRCAMPELTSLAIRDCRISDGADLAALPTAAPALVELRLTWLTLAEAPTLPLPRLRVADLSRSSLPTTIWQQAPGAWPTLEHLLLDGDAQAVSLDVVGSLCASAPWTGQKRSSCFEHCFCRVPVCPSIFLDAMRCNVKATFFAVTLQSPRLCCLSLGCGLPTYECICALTAGERGGSDAEHFVRGRACARGSRSAHVCPGPPCARPALPWRAAVAAGVAEDARLSGDG